MGKIFVTPIDSMGLFGIDTSKILGVKQIYKDFTFDEVTGEAKHDEKVAILLDVKAKDSTGALQVVEETLAEVIALLRAAGDTVAMTEREQKHPDAQLGGVDLVVPDTTLVDADGQPLASGN